MQKRREEWRSIGEDNANASNLSREEDRALRLSSTKVSALGTRQTCPEFLAGVKSSVIVSPVWWVCTTLLHAAQPVWPVRQAPNPLSLSPGMQQTVDLSSNNSLSIHSLGPHSFQNARHCFHIMCQNGPLIVLPCQVALQVLQFVYLYHIWILELVQFEIFRFKYLDGKEFEKH